MRLLPCVITISFRQGADSTPKNATRRSSEYSDLVLHHRAEEWLNGPLNYNAGAKSEGSPKGKENAVGSKTRPTVLEPRKNREQRKEKPTT